MPKVSVIIPAYNRAGYIIQTLQSVFAQTFTDYEVIVIDDGSTDDTEDALKPYSGRITYIRKANGGQGSARNVGIRMAKGEYIAFLDSDDLWLPEKLKTQVTFMDNHPEYGLTFSGCEFIDDAGKVIGEWSSPLDFSFDSILLRGNYIMIPTVMVRRDVFDQAGLFNEARELISVEDYDMWLRIGLTYKIGYVDPVMARYRFHSGNISLSKKKMHGKSVSVLEKFALSDAMPDRDMRTRALRSVAMWLFEQGCMTGDRASMERSRDMFLRVLRMRPSFLLGYLYVFMSFLNLRFVRFLKECEYRLRGRQSVFRS
ncbi:MAG: glycosyltransferase [Nitrospirae bacterium]|nr:glycosyltransferase [Nitrospirota bacterium]